MRIVGGKFRGRTLASPSSSQIRPTTDRTRESLFNILQHRHDFSELRIIDLFAGTGALGFEALSRGASFALFVENSKIARAIIQTNIQNLTLNSLTQIDRRDATNLRSVGNIAPFDIAFLDPPYAKSLGEKAMTELAKGSWLNRDATIVLEERKDAFPEIVTGYRLVDKREFGDTSIGIFKIE